MDPELTESSRPLTVSDYNRRKARHFAECYLSRSDASMSSARGSSGEESDGYEDDVIEDADTDILAPAVFGVNLGATLRQPPPVEGPNTTIRLYIPKSAPESEPQPSELTAAPELPFPVDTMPRYPTLQDSDPSIPATANSNEPVAPPPDGFFSWMGSFLGFGPSKSPAPASAPSSEPARTPSPEESTSTPSQPATATKLPTKPGEANQNAPLPNRSPASSQPAPTPPTSTAPVPQNNYYFIFSGGNPDPAALPPQVKALMDNALSASGAVPPSSSSSSSSSGDSYTHSPSQPRFIPSNQPQNPARAPSNPQYSSGVSSVPPAPFAPQPPQSSLNAPPPPPPLPADSSGYGTGGAGGAGGAEGAGGAGTGSMSTTSSAPPPPPPPMSSDAPPPPPPPMSSSGESMGAPPPPASQAAPGTFPPAAPSASPAPISIRQEAVGAEARAARAKEKRAAEEAKKARSAWLLEMTALVNMCTTLKDESKKEAVQYWTEWYGTNIPHANLLTSAYFMFLRKIPKQFALIAAAIQFWENSLFEQLAQDANLDAASVTALRTKRAPFLCDMEEKWFRNKEMTPDQVNEERIKLLDATFAAIEEQIRQEKQSDEKKALQEELGNALRRVKDRVEGDEEVIEYDE